MTPLTWALAPDLLTIDECCRLAGWDRATMHEAIKAGGVDLDDYGLIFKDSLSEFLETLVELAHWDE